MKKFRSLPAINTLLAGFIACVVMIINQYTLVNFIWILVCTMLVFFVISIGLCFLLNKVFAVNEEDFLEESDMMDEEFMESDFSEDENQ